MTSIRPSLGWRDQKTSNVSGSCLGRDHSDDHVRKLAVRTKAINASHLTAIFLLDILRSCIETGFGSAVPCVNPGACAVRPALRLERADRLRGLSLNSACGRSLTAVCRDEPDAPAPRGPSAAQRSRRYRRFTATVAATRRRGSAGSIQPSDPRRHQQDPL